VSSFWYAVQALGRASMDRTHIASSPVMSIDPSVASAVINYLPRGTVHKSLGDRPTGTTGAKGNRRTLSH